LRRDIRDRVFQEHGLRVVHLPGPAIHPDPLAAVKEVLRGLAP
jgi:hypothetical protein